MKKRFIGLYGIFVISLFFGALLFLDPYLLTQNETVPSVDTWYQGNTHEAYFYFKLSSTAFITTNYPVTVHVKVVVFDPKLTPIINSKQYPAIAITNTEYSPITYSPENGLPNTGTIVLKFDGNRTYEGEGTLIFPFMGTNYDYTFWTLNSVQDAQLIYGENKSSPTSSATPPFSIDEGYAARASFEQANKSNGISFFAVGIAGIALVAYVQFETNKSRVNDFAEIEKQLRKLNDTLERFINNYQKDKNKEKSKANS